MIAAGAATRINVAVSHIRQVESRCWKVYYIPMSQPKNHPLSVRCRPALKAQIGAAAAVLGTKPNALVVRWIEEGLARDAQEEVANLAPKVEPKAVLALAEAKAAHLAKPPPKRRHPRWSSSLQVGPTRPPAGSRLKGASKVQAPKR